jgi:hypothetical protein
MHDKYNYVWNARTGYWTQSGHKKISMVKKPSKVMLLGDGGSSSGGETACYSHLGLDGGDIISASSTYRLGNPHNLHCQMGILDGHAESIKYGSTTTEMLGDKLPWNN